MIIFFAWQAACGQLAPVCSNHSVLSRFPSGGSCTSEIKTVAEWEMRRSDIMVGVQALMGELPSRKNLPPLDVRVKKSIALRPIAAKSRRSPTALALPICSWYG